MWGRGGGLDQTQIVIPCGRNMSYTNTVSKCAYTTTTVGVVTVDERGEQEADAAELLEQPGYMSSTGTQYKRSLVYRHSHPQLSSPPLSTLLGMREPENESNIN